MRVRPLVRASVSILMKGDGWNPSTRSTAIPIVILAILTAAVGQDAGRIGGGPPTGRPDAAAAEITSRRARAAELLLHGKAREAASLYAEILAADPSDTESMEGRVRALIA